MANRLAAPTCRRPVKLNITWISGHDDVEGNEEADKEAKKAAAADESATCLPETDHTTAQHRRYATSLQIGAPPDVEKQMDTITTVYPHGTNR
jgi:hypothetical protein